MPASAVPLTLHAAPAAGFDEPFEMLAACHERVERMLRLLERLAAHLADKGHDEAGAAAARDVMRYFDQAGPAHHEDEERHVFPALLAAGDATLGPPVRQLQAEHLRMTADWAALRADLAEVAAGAWPLPPAPAALERWRAFATLYRAHIELEDRLAYPAAAARLGAAERSAMGEEMARRRGVR